MSGQMGVIGSWQQLWHRLAAVYGEHEAKAVARWLLETAFGLSMADVLCDGLARLTTAEQHRLELMLARLEQGEPVQYVAGVADFCGRQFLVEPGVLIPRPETAELCQWIVADADKADADILDIGTGSGCIAVTLALGIPKSRVTAWDISDTALRVAGENAAKAGVSIATERHDALRPTAYGHWDIIVSNPPYIYHKERASMDANVLDYEPHEALFAPDDNPLLFYQRIADYARRTLTPGGSLYFELNPLLADTVGDYLQRCGLHSPQIREDQFGKRRFIKAIQP